MRKARRHLEPLDRQGGSVFDPEAARRRRLSSVITVVPSATRDMFLVLFPHHPGHLNFHTECRRHSLLLYRC